jgi:thioredoxin reductase (NADPH)
MYDVIVLGSGPAGLTAAIYTTRASLKTLVIAGEKWGGQLQLTTEVENFPGFPEGIQGPELMTNMRKQAEHHGAEFVDENFTSGDFSKSPFTVHAGEKSYEGKSIIIATGADTKWLGVPGEKEKIGRGVSSCAPCDAPFFREKNVIVVGGGDSAMEEALVLTRFAKHVTLIYRGDTLRASEIMQKRVFENGKISIIYNTVIGEVKGDQKVEKVALSTTCTDGSVIVKFADRMATTTVDTIGGKEIKRGENTLEWELPTDGIFVAIGHIPNSKVFPGIDVDEKGFIIVHEHTRTNKEGVFVAGDVHDKQYMQAVTAAGFGCAAALEAERWLEARE